MSESRDQPGRVAAAEAALEAEPIPRCETCGAERRPGDPILCRICGEPVLGDGWAP